MKSKVIALAVLLIAVCAISIAAPNDNDSDSKVRNVTGCLKQGDGANEFELLANDGSSWELRSDKVNLAPHVGHTVTITGTRSGVHAEAHELKEKTKSEMAEHDMKKDASEHGHLKVEHLKMVSASCKP
jgi:hypothetical protein